MASNLRDLENKVKNLLGLNSYEARAYLTLLRLGALRPLEVAREANIPQQRIYDVLASLRRRGLLVEQNGVYTPVNPVDSLAEIAEEILLEAHKRADEVRKLASILSSIASTASREELRIVYGINPSIASAIRAVKSCELQPLFVAYKVLEVIREAWPLLVRLLAEAKGAIILVPEFANIDEEYIRKAEKMGAVIIRSKYSIMDLMIACDTVIIGLPSKVHEVISLVIVNREFAKALENRIRELIGFSQ